MDLGLHRVQGEENSLIFTRFLSVERRPIPDAFFFVDYQHDEDCRDSWRLRGFAVSFSNLT
jgi:hypothetical protein